MVGHEIQHNGAFDVFYNAKEFIDGFDINDPIVPLFIIKTKQWQSECITHLDVAMRSPWLECIQKAIDSWGAILFQTAADVLHLTHFSC